MNSRPVFEMQVASPGIQRVITLVAPANPEKGDTTCLKIQGLKKPGGRILG